MVRSWPCVRVKAFGMVSCFGFSKFGTHQGTNNPPPISSMRSMDSALPWMQSSAVTPLNFVQVRNWQGPPRCYTSHPERMSFGTRLASRHFIHFMHSTMRDVVNICPHVKLDNHQVPDVVRFIQCFLNRQVRSLKSTCCHPSLDFGRFDVLWRTNNPAMKMYLDICMFVRTCMKIGRYFGGREMLVWWSPTCSLGPPKVKKMIFVDSPIVFVLFSAEFVMLEGLFFQSGGPMLSSFSLPLSFRDCCFRLLWSGAAFLLFWWCCRKTVLFVRASCFFAGQGGLDLLAGWLGRFGFGLFLCSFGCVFMFGSCDFTKTFCSRTGLMTSRMVHGAALTLCQGEGAQLLRRVERHRLKERARNVVLITQPDIALSLGVVICLSDWIHVAAFACLKSVQDSERRAQWQNKTQTKIFRVFEIVHFFFWTSYSRFTAATHLSMLHDLF